MSYLLTNQNNFGNIPYPSPSSKGATVKSGGCGPCSALMVVENLTENRIGMARWIDWVMDTGARVSGGTSLRTLGQAIAKKFGLEYSTTSNEAVLAAHLKAGGMAIANVGGKRDGWPGLFSNAGHFITVLGILKDGRFIIGDPGFYKGKFSGSWRKARCEVDGQLVYVTPEILHKDTLERTPNYYLFSAPAREETLDEPNENKGDDEVRYSQLTDIPEWGKKTVEKLIAKGIIKGNGVDLDISEDMLRVLVWNDRANLYE